MQKICLVIPCYNEEKRIKEELFFAYLMENCNVNVCFVNDGSQDKTVSVINTICEKKPEQIFMHDLKINYGKAEAVRSGILHVCQMEKYDYIGFWDADFSTPIAELDAMLKFIAARPSCKVLMGSRVKRLGARINRNLLRHIFGRVFSTFSNWILKFPVYDSQCGAKIFRQDIIMSVFSDRFTTRWIFDIEILARIRNKYGIENTSDIICELPLSNWEDIKG